MEAKKKKRKEKSRHQNFVVGQTNQSAKKMSHYKTKLNNKLIQFYYILWEQL